MADDIVGQIVLAEQHVVAALGDLAHRALAARAHPERRVWALCGRRLDDDIVVLPVSTAMAEPRIRDKGLGNDIHRLVEPRISFLHRHAEPGEFVVAIAFADAEIEPAAREQIERRRLLGEQHRVVPGQHEDGRAEAQGRGARAEPGQQIEARRDLAEPGEMVLDDKGAVKAERLGLDIVLDPVAEALAAVGIRRHGIRPARLRAAKESEPHQ